MEYMNRVHEIEGLYSPDRLARSKARLTAVWQLRRPPDRVPFVYGSLPPADGQPAYDIWDGNLTSEESLVAQIAMISDRAILDDDYVPSLYAGCRQGTIPTAFGAEEVRSADHTWVKPMIRDAADVYALEPPNLRENGVAAEFLERIRFFRRATEGRMPIQLPDMQGPLDLANNMWGTEPLLVAMRTHPEAVHHLLQIVTDAFIEYVRLVDEAAQGDLVPIHCMPVVWMPRERGVALSEDLLAVMSPALYRTFGVPYNEQIAAAFGGIIVHSCGSVEHNLGILAGTRGLTGVNFGATETSLPAVAEAVKGKATIVSHMGKTTCHDLQPLSTEEHIRLAAKTFRESKAWGIIYVTLLDLNREEALALCPVAAELVRLDGLR